MTSSKRFKQDCVSKVSLTHQGHKYNKKVFEWKEMYDDGHLVDFTIKTSGEDILCHRVILTTKLPFFKVMYDISRYSDSGPFETADLSFLHPASLKQIIEFAYTSEISCSENDIEQLVDAACYLQADDVIAKCDTFLEETVNKDNSLKFFIIGSTYTLPLITKKASKLVLKHFSSLINTEEFPELHVQDLWTFIHDDSLNVLSEEVVFDAILKWIEYDPVSRQKAANELLKAVRVDHLSEAFLSSLLEDEKYESALPVNFYTYADSVLHQRFGQGQGRHTKSKKSFSAPVQQPRFSYSKNKLLVIGGTAHNLNKNNENIRDCIYWDRVEESWTKFTELPNCYTDCYEWSVCVGDGRIFVSGGYHVESSHSEGSSQVWMWHNNSWKALPPMIHGRWAHGFVYADKKLFVFGGKSHKQNRIKCLKYNEFLDLKPLEQSGDTVSLLGTLSWQQTTTMKFRFHSPLISILGDSIYLLGMSGFSFLTFKENAYRFSISKHTLKKLSNVPFNAGVGVSTTVGDNIFVFGDKHPQLARYTPSTDTWCDLTPSGSIEDNRAQITYSFDRISQPAIVDGRIILAKLKLERKGKYTRIVDEYNVEKNTWSKTDLTLAPCFNNKILSLLSAEIDV